MPIIERDWELPDTGPQPHGRASRSGAPWTLEEYQVLVDAAKDGLALDDIATTLRRSHGAITSRARRLIPTDRARVGSSWWEDLCVLFEDDPDHDWEDCLRGSGELLLDYDTIHQIEQLPRDQATSITTIKALLGAHHENAETLLRRHGHSPVPSPVPPLLVRNLLDDDTHLPTRAHTDDAGLDLRYAGTDPVTIPAGGHVLLPTGIAVAIPHGHAGLICPRSGLAAKHGITIINAPGIIDHGYTGEIKVCLGILGPHGHTINPGERIAQLVLTPVTTPPVTYVNALDNTNRGDDGFGSTGTD